MARKDNKWIKSRRVGEVTLYVTRRSPYWQMYWIDGVCESGGKPRPRERRQSTRETDYALASIIAARKNEELYKRQHFAPETQRTQPARHDLREQVNQFLAYLETQNRSYGHVHTLRGQLACFATWAADRGIIAVQDVTAGLLGSFRRHLLDVRRVKASTANAYTDALHNFFGYVIFKKKLMPGPNPAATGRQAELDPLPEQRLRPPTITPAQVNDVLRVASDRDDRQIVHLVVFVCDGGFRFQEVQFLQVKDLRREEREIVLDVKRPDPSHVRYELRRRCLDASGYWSPKTLAGRRPVHISDRMMRSIEAMRLGDPDDWVFKNSVGMQVSQNKTLVRLKACALDAGVLVERNPRSGEDWSTIRWHWLRHYHRTRAHVSGIRRDVSKLAMGHAADPIHDHYRGVDAAAFHEEYGKFDSGIDERLLIEH